MLLEPEIAARAALMANDEQLERMRHALERMKELQDDSDAYVEIDVDFHSELAAATGNVVLAFVLDSVRELLRVSRRVTNLINAVPEATVAHRRIYEAVLAREPEAARQAMRAHLLTVTEVWAPGSSERRSRLRCTAATERSFAGSVDAETTGSSRCFCEAGNPYREVEGRMGTDAAVPPLGGAMPAAVGRRDGTPGGSDRVLGQHGAGGHAHRTGAERPARTDVHRQLRGRDRTDRVSARRHHLPRRCSRPDAARQAVHGRGRLLPLHQPHDRATLRLADDVALLPLRPGRDRHRLRVHRLTRARHAEGPVRLERPMVDRLRRARRLRLGVHAVRDRDLREGHAHARGDRGRGLRRFDDLGARVAGRRRAQLDSFNPGNIPSGNGLYLGIVFTILALSGFESVAPLGEETENPKRNLPLAIVGSTILVALFYMFVNWGVLVGEGTDNVKNFTSADQIFDLGRRLWGGAWIIILIAAVNSGLAVCIAIQNATTRVLFDMGRVRALPPLLGKVHPRYRTPWNAIWFLTGVTLAIGLGLGSWLGPVKTFGMIGIMQTLGLIIVYSMGNIGAMLFYGREKKDEFNVVLHARHPDPDHGCAGLGLLEERGDTAPVQSEERVRLQPADRDDLDRRRPGDRARGQPDRKGGMAQQCGRVRAIPSRNGGRGRTSAGPVGRRIEPPPGAQLRSRRRRP